MDRERIAITAVLLFLAYGYGLYLYSRYLQWRSDRAYQRYAEWRKANPTDWRAAIVIDLDEPDKPAPGAQ